MSSVAEAAPKEISLTDLERPCAACAGKGWVKIGGGTLECDVCDGRGAQMTDAGRQVFSFVARWMS
jgi:DnaJ-class molecular chaperone